MWFVFGFFCRCFGFWGFYEIGFVVVSNFYNIRLWCIGWIGGRCVGLVVLCFVFLMFYMCGVFVVMFGLVVMVLMFLFFVVCFYFMLCFG